MSRGKLGKLVTEALEELKQLSYERLALDNEPSRHFTVNGREATLNISTRLHCRDPLSILSQPESALIPNAGSIKVVVEAKGWIVNVIDGFWKHPDGSVTDCDPDDLWD